MMTYSQALETAIAALSTGFTDTELIERLTALKAKYDAPKSPISDEKKAAISAKRKEATAAARAELVGSVAPVLRKYLDTDRTAKEIYTLAQSELPADFNWQKVQNVLLRELEPEVIKTPHNGGANTYRLR